MSVPDAMRFISAVRAAPSLLPAIPTFEGCRPIAQRLGLDFSPEEFRNAHAKDWALRWFHYRKSGPPGQTVASTAADIFALLASQLPPALFDARVGDNFQHWARGLPPFSWAGFVGFECPLGLKNPRIDFHREIQAGEDAAAFADSLAEGTRFAAALEPVRERLREFCQRWTQPGSPLNGNVSDIILEFDMLAEGAPPPAIFLATRHQIPPYKLSLEDSHQVTVAAAQLLAGGSPSAALLVSLTRCFENCPANARISHAAVMLSRTGETTRLNIKDLAHDQFLPFLASIGWKGPRRAIEELLADAFAGVDHITLAIDVGTSIGDVVGLECAVDGSASEWRPILDHLVESGMATAPERDALLEWPSLITPQDAVNAWPEHLVLDSLRRPSNEFSRFRRYLSHIKVSWRPGSPLRAKAYLGINHRWMKADQTVETTTWEGPTYSVRPAIYDPSQKDQSHHIAVVKGIGYLLGHRIQGGWWSDFSLKDPGEEYVTAFVATALAETLQPDARRAAEWAWQLLARRDHFMKGWSWNRHSPPDADSTAWGLRLAQALGVEHCERIRAARIFLERHRQSDGAVACYVDWEGQGPARDAGWRIGHVCITASAAGVAGLPGDSLEFLRSVQRDDGSWQAYWWSDDEFTTALAAEALFAGGLAADRARIARAVHWALHRLSPDGFVRSVGGAESAFGTAWCLRILALDSNEPSLRIARLGATRWLIANQREDGSWAPSALMRIPPRDMFRPIDGPDNINLLDRNANFTTAAVVAALVSAGRVEAPL